LRELSREHIRFRESVRRFAEEEVLIVAREIDEKDLIPDDLIASLGKEGLMGMIVPEEYGGLGKDLLSYVLALEELSKASPAVALIVTVNNSLVCAPIEEFGSVEQRERYLPRLARGECLGAFALTEPDAGSDAGSITTSAREEGGSYIITGEKVFTTNVGRSSLVVVFARTSEQGPGGISAFLIELPRDGTTTGESLEMMGMRGSIQMRFTMEDAVVPVESMMGTEGDGFEIAMWSLDRGRLGIAAQGLGIAQACLDDALVHGARREQFGRPISKFQAVQFRLVDMMTSIEGARCLTWRAARRMNGGNSTPGDAAMAKLLASRAAVEVSGDALYLMGGRGYLKGCRVERMYRDAKVTEIYEGTSDVQRMVLARDMMASM